MFAAFTLPLLAQDQPAGLPVPTSPPATTEPVEKSQVSQTEMQPMFGAQLPATASWKPLTTGERWKIFYEQGFVPPVTVVRPLIPTVLTFASHSPERWGRTWGGLGHRFAANWVGTVVGDFTETAGAAMLHHETRYIACHQCKSVKARMWNSLRQVVQTYDGNGKWVFAGPRVVSSYASAAVTVYGLYPQEPHQLRSFLAFGTSQFYYSAIGDVSREFLPDLLRLIRRKKNRTSLAPPPPLPGK
ncbi:MAG: hypothetical protein NTV70_01785 [Acidobacteria bacterium]|nr:hypothetical protein [Acidobacteriota bacterium]